MENSNTETISQPAVNQSVQKKKGGCGQMMCLGCLSIFLVIIVIIGVVLAVILSENQTWNKNFEAEKGDFVSIDREEFSDDMYNAVLEKTAEFSEDTEEIDYIELTPEEVSIIIFSVLKGSIPEQMFLREVVIDARDQSWSLYIDVLYSGIDLPWLMIELKEDSEQSMNLSVQNARFGVIKLKEDGPFKILEKINEGYLNGVGITDENEVTGRELVNIELEKEALFIKGELREDQ